jgi:CRISPR-associated endonuclease/helicase Cas3
LDQALCIVNLKRHARTLFNLLAPRWGCAVFHLSTSMCPKHRAAVLGRVSARLELGYRCTLIATQCVEAGVDLDFPVAFRALGPLDSIAQAAGRCNRNGKSAEGVLTVFVPEDAGYPPGVYKQASDLTALLLNREEGLSIDDAAGFDDYFRQLYSITNLEDRDLLQAIKTKHFPDVRKFYRVIDQDSVNVLVPYERKIYEELADEVRSTGLSRDWVLRARPYTVGCFRRDIEAATAMVEEVRLKDRTLSGDWFIYLAYEHYDSQTGLLVPKELDYLEG